jgi:hypothetical protein
MRHQFRRVLKHSGRNRKRKVAQATVSESTVTGSGIIGCFQTRGAAELKIRGAVNVSDVHKKNSTSLYYVKEIVDRRPTRPLLRPDFRKSACNPPGNDL